MKRVEDDSKGTKGATAKSGCHLRGGVIGTWKLKRAPPPTASAEIQTFLPKVWPP